MVRNYELCPERKTFKGLASQSQQPGSVRYLLYDRIWKTKTWNCHIWEAEAVKSLLEKLLEWFIDSPNICWLPADQQTEVASKKRKSKTTKPPATVTSCHCRRRKKKKKKKRFYRLSPKWLFQIAIKQRKGEKKKRSRWSFTSAARLRRGRPPPRCGTFDE